jgi:hypothetical protein
MRVALFGVGEAATAIARNLRDKGVDIVGAFSRTTGTGQDVGEFLGLGHQTGVVISADPATELAGLGADVGIIATESSLESQIPLAGLCLEHDMDVLSLAEEGFFPSTAALGVAEKLDRLAVAAGRTVFFGGIQDVFWHAAPLVLVSGGHTIHRVTGRTVSDLEDLGASTLASYPLGLKAHEFDEALSANQEAALFAMGPAVDVLVRRLGLDVAERRTWVEPVLADADRYSAVLDTTIKPGRTCGLTEWTSVVSTQGIQVQTAFVSEVLDHGQQPSIQWRVEGEPEIEMRFDAFPGYECTAATLVNRVPAVIAAPPGYRTVLDLPAPVWWSGERSMCT